MGLYAHICTSKCAAGSPTPAAAAEREHFCTELALFAGCRAHKTPKTGHYLRDNLTTWASMLISALLDVPLGRPARPPRGLRQLLPLQGLNGDGNRERAAGRTATEHSPGWMSRGPRCLPMSRASRAVLRTHCRATSSIASTAARIKWRWEQGAHSRAHRPRAPPRLDVSRSLMPTNVPRVRSRPAHVLPSGDLLYAMPAPMNHVKYLRAGPAEMPFQNWYTTNTNHLNPTDSVKMK